MMSKPYKTDFLNFRRRPSRAVNIGGVPLGGDNIIRLQSMTNTPTSDVRSTVRQIIDIAHAGSDYVRMTVPGKRDAEALPDIVAELSKHNCVVPLIADIHFNPALALLSAAVVDKVRINPGNYVDRKHFAELEYSEKEYNLELARLREKFIDLLRVCREHGTAIRIGTNHGSLSDRIMSRYGDTAMGMAESAMEFLRICKSEDFRDVVVSMKASNTRIMVYATRLLVAGMHAEGMDYPLHLGVTEAGEGEDGRIRSAVGIGALLADGIGDTIRVSLTEDPELEIPVAAKLRDYVAGFSGHQPIPEFGDYPIDAFSYNRRTSAAAGAVGGENVPVVIHSCSDTISYEELSEIGWNYRPGHGWEFSDLAPDYLLFDHWPGHLSGLPANRILVSWSAKDNFMGIPVVHPDQLYNPGINSHEQIFVRINAGELSGVMINQLSEFPGAVLMLSSENSYAFADMRSAIFRLINAGVTNPVILCRQFGEKDPEDFRIKASVDLGGLWIDGLGDGILLENRGVIPPAVINSTAFGILQASRVRISKTEFISCPSCGRTLFDLQATTRRIREKTSHLKGLKIGIMGCIVNGPGEMADADYGYVGAGKGRITLYKQKDVVARNIPEDEAVNALIDLIRENGDWTDP